MHSPQETPPGSGNSCHNPWCIAGIGISSLSQHDSQVTPCSFSHYLYLFCSPPPHFWQETKQIQGRKHKLCCLGRAYAIVLHTVQKHILVPPASNNSFYSHVSLFCPPHTFSQLINSVSQGCESRKYLANRARSGQTGRLWFCLHRRSSQLLCGNTLLVRLTTVSSTSLNHGSENSYYRLSHMNHTVLSHQSLHLAHISVIGYAKQTFTKNKSPVLKKISQYS